MDELKIIKISIYLSNGFTCPEIAKKMKIHRVTVQRYKSELKRRYIEFKKTNSI